MDYSRGRPIRNPLQTTPEPSVRERRPDSRLMTRRMGRLRLEASFDMMPVSFDRFSRVVLT